MNRRIGGFTIFEMVIVLIMLGILTAGLAPLLRTQHTQTMEDANRKGLNTARDVLITYALTNGGLPVPLTGAAAIATNKQVYEPTYIAGTQIANSAKSYLPWDEYMVSLPTPLPPLGVPTFGSYRKFFWYDPRTELRTDYMILTLAGLDGQNPRYMPLLEAKTGFPGGPLPGAIDPRLSLCANVRTAMKLATVTDPRVCRLPNNSEMSDSCPGTAATASPAAFVIASFGNDRTPDKAHADIDTDPATSVNVRNYENPARPVNYEHSAAPDIHYDDAVVSVSLAELASRCDQSGVACSADKRYLTIKNTSGAEQTLYYKTGGGVCTPVTIASDTRSSLGCLDSATTLWTDAGCATSFGIGVAALFTSLSDVDSIANLDGSAAVIDSNGDGVASIWFAPSSAIRAW